MHLPLASEHRAKLEAFQHKHRTGVLTLLFTDMVGSTSLKQELGEFKAVTVLQNREALFRALLAGFSDAEEVDKTGDSFFVIFARPSDAVRFAVLLQARLRRFGEEQGQPVRDRIGIHLGEVVIRAQAGSQAKDLYGIQLDAAARVMSLAEGDQILLTRAAFDNARLLLQGADLEGVGGLCWMSHGLYVLKGVDDPVEVCEVGEAETAVLKPPPDSEKVRRYINPEAEPVLGWRPALGQGVPNTQWVLERKLGEGTFGEVWLGHHHTLKERRVFKFCFRAERVRSLKREVTIFRLLRERVGRHPNIVGVQEVFFDKPPYYVIMEYAEGKDLRAWCEERGGAARVPLATRLAIVAQIADGLAAAHQAAVVHRDLKPSNILVCSPSVPGRSGPDAEPTARLTDFGVGQVVAQEALAGITRLGFTQTNAPSGSSGQIGLHVYFAPELLAGKAASPRSDIYSLGVVLYQLLVGDFNQPVTTDWSRRIEDPLLREALGKCFAGNPEERFSRAEELAGALRGLEQRRSERLQIAEPADQAGAVIGRYRILEKIGEGGFGAVYLAEQREPVKRRVALKIIKLGMDTKEVIARFDIERQALALMDHPNIAKVLDAGSTDSGRPFFVMELVRGVKITEYCDQHNLSMEQRLGLFVQVCGAVQHAHQKGIIHRDIKPSNILVTLQEDGIPVPKIIDFGIAKATSGQRLTDKTLFTALEQFIGTPAYMSPEQAEMTGLDVDTRSDIYSLGVLLYELLTGKTPFDATRLVQAGLDEIRRIIREEDPPRPSTRISTLAAEEQTTVARRRHAEPPKLIHLVRGDLDWIVMKALEKDRTRRYPTANGLASDIRRHLDSEPVEARPPSASYKLLKFGRRHKASLAAAAVILGLLVAGVFISSVLALRATRAEQAQRQLREAAERARAQEEATSRKFQEKSQQLSETLSQLEQQKINEALIKAGPASGLAVLADVLRRNPDNYRAAYRLLSMLSHKDCARFISYKKYEGQIRAMFYGSAGPLLVTSSGNRDLWVWNYEKDQAIAGPLSHSEAIQSHSQAIQGVQFSPTGEKLLVLLPNSIEVWTIPDWRAPAFSMEAGPDAWPSAFSSDEMKLVTRRLENQTTLLQVWDFQTGQPLTKPVPYEEPSSGLGIQFSRDGTKVGISQTSFESVGEGGGPRQIRRWLDIATGTLGDKKISSYYSDSEAGGGPSPRYELSRSSNEAGQLRISGGGRTRQILFAGVLQSVRVSSEDSVSTEQLSPDGRQILSSSKDGTVRLWDVAPRSVTQISIPLQAAGGQGGSQAWSVKFPRDLKCVLVKNTVGTASVWDCSTGRPVVNPLGEAGAVFTAALSPDGKIAVIRETNGWTRVWAVPEGRRISEFFEKPKKGTAYERGEFDVSFSGTGERFAVCSVTGTAQVRETRSMKLLGEVTPGNWSPLEVRLSEDGTRLVTVDESGAARVWNALTGVPLTGELRHDQDEIDSCELSPNGKLLATTSGHKVARIWKIQEGHTDFIPLKHEADVLSLQFQSDGFLVTLATDRTVSTWDPAQGTLVKAFKPDMPKDSRGWSDQEAHELQIGLSEDARSLALYSAEDELRIWDMPTGTPLSEALMPASHSYSVGEKRRKLWLSAGRLALARWDELLLWELPHVNGEVPEWLPRLAEILAGVRVTPKGWDDTDPGHYPAFRQSITAALKQDSFSDWGRWFLAAQPARTIAPFSSATVSEYVQVCVERKDRSLLREALELEPGNLDSLTAYLELIAKDLLRNEQRSNMREMEVLADMVLRAQPKNVTAWKVKSYALAMQGRAALSLEALAHLNPAELDAACLNTKALAFELLSKTNEALQALTQAIEIARRSSPNSIQPLYLRRSEFLKKQNRIAEAAADACLAIGIAPRASDVASNLIDLSFCYTASLTNFALPNVRWGAFSAFSAMPIGVQTLAGIDFDVRGASIPRVAYRYPADGRKTSIPINVRCQKLHFLHGVAHSSSFVGNRPPNYTVHYADGQSAEMEVVTGKNVWDWQYRDGQPLETTDAPLAWAGVHERGCGTFSRLYRMSWVNPRPDVQVASVDLPAAAAAPITPFLIALTAESADSDLKETKPTAPSAGAVARQTLETLDKAIAQNPDCFIFTVAKAGVLERMRRKEEALSLLTESVKRGESERAATNLLVSALDCRGGLLRRMGRASEAQADWLRASNIPKRDANAQRAQLDLSAHYNCPLRMARSGYTNEFPGLDAGLTTLAGVTFDIRGIIQLSGSELAETFRDSPQTESASGIPVGQKIARVHALHATSWAAAKGDTIGMLVLRYAGGEQRELPIRYGIEVLDHWFQPAKQEEPQGSSLAWSGSTSQTFWSNGRSRPRWVRLYKTTWENPLPADQVESVDYVSKMTTASPFLLALTVE